MGRGLAGGSRCDYGADLELVLGYSFADFIDGWTLLGCVGPDDWLMTPFLHPDSPYLDAIGEAARSWRAWFGLDALAVACKAPGRGKSETPDGREP